MESRENMMPKVETVTPEGPSSFQLALRTDSANQTGNPSQVAGAMEFSPASGGMSSSLVKKKRGRPRKYGPDGAVSGGQTMPPMPIFTSSSPNSGGFSDTKFGETAGSSGGGSFPAEKKKRRMSSLETKPGMCLGDRISSGGSFTPHMVTINPGEDVTSKIISFSKHGPRAICVLSALGVISHVTLRQASSSGGTVTYEGRFEILSLTGSFTPGEVGGILSREGGLSIALSSPDGRVVGGLLGGLLTAAGPVQVVVASFLPDIGSPIEPKPRKQKNVIKQLTPTGGNTNSTPVDQQNLNEQNQDGPGPSPAGGNTNSTLAPNFNHENRATMPTVHDWRRATTDMNVSLRED